MTNFFLRDGDTQRAHGAQHMDDIDLVESKSARGVWGPSLVAVAQRGGVHVCWYCGEMFDEESKKLRGVEVQVGYARIMLHAACVNRESKSFRSFDDLTRGHQLRRFAGKAVKSLGGLLSGDSNANEPQNSK